MIDESSAPHEAPKSDWVADIKDDDKTKTVEIRAELAGQFTFASHQNDIAIMADLVIVNSTEEDLSNLTLHASAEPNVIGTKVWTIDRIVACSELRIRDRRIPFAGGLLNELTERMRADICIELRRGDQVLAKLMHPVVALARNEWGGARHMPELLAAFVAPNDPAVQRLLRDASSILRDASKSGSLEGYQSGSPKRSWEIVAGIWAAVVARGLTYTEPPASFETDGQKIRLPSMIETHGLATCLDIALLFAAAIEQAGLNPVLVFTRGHALCGAWLQPQSLPTLTVDDVMEIRKPIDSKEMVLFETTLAAAGVSLPFTKAASAGREQVDEINEDEFVYAIDIARARGRGIQPISGFADTGGDGKIDAGSIARSIPALDVPPDLPESYTEEAEEPVPTTSEERLERWKRSLLDLSKRNRLLNLRDSKTAIPIFCPDPAALEDRIAAGKRIRIVTAEPRRGENGEIDPVLRLLKTGDELAVREAKEALERNEIIANTDEKSLEKGIVELFRKAKADFEEGGSNTLFLAIGMLRWRPTSDGSRSYRAPLILLPVKLVRRSASSKPYLTSHDDDPIFNLTLLQMLRQDFAIEIPELGGALPADESGVDVRRIWESVRMRVREVPGFEVVEDVVLSTFSFAKYLMWKDLAERTEKLKISPFVRHMIDTPREIYAGGAGFMDPAEIDDKIEPGSVLAPLNADSSQIVAIQASGNGGDFVLEGPPGTGKSETIGNIIAHNIGLGRRVLFVSEKMAALEVVYRRLQEHGLGDFCLELHSARANKRAVIEQLGAAWENRAADTPTGWDAKAGRLGDIRRQLNGLVTALHSPGPAGISPRDAIGRSLRYGDLHRLSLDWGRDDQALGHAATPEEFARLKEIAKSLARNFGQLESEDFSAFKSIGHTDWSIAWQSEISDSARNLSVALSALGKHRKEFVEKLGIADAGSDPRESETLADIASLVPACAAADSACTLASDGKDVIATIENACVKLEAYRKMHDRLPTGYSDQRIADVNVDGWFAQRNEAQAKVWPFNAIALGRLRKAMRAHFGLTKSKARAPDLSLDLLRNLARRRAEIAMLTGQLPERTPWNGFETDLERSRRALNAGSRLREAVLRLAGYGRDLSETRVQLAKVLGDGRDLLEPGMPIADAAFEFVQAHEEFARKFEAFRAAASLDEDILDLREFEETLGCIAERARRLNRWCRWIESARDARGKGLGALALALKAGSVTPDQAVETFHTAYCVWLAPILIDARPELRRFSSVAHEELIKTFRDLDKHLAEITSEQIRARLSSKVPGPTEAGRDPRYGVLSRELQKKMRHKPVRQLVSEMRDALTTLTPCLLMSPLSVAQFLPADQTSFDLVVFDEASQITVPDAIGAIARGQNCIVVGDPKQMPPTRFFEKGAEDNDNEDARDLESILDEALAARVPHHRLSGHYRSRHESLICFSNHAYYQGTLVTYPSASTSDSAVHFHRVDGVYAKGKARTNEIEAKAVVAEVVARLSDSARNDLSIGVVTLNSEQQRLVEDLLDQERRADPDLERFFGPEAEEAVFVKNLETVQGDQRDVILLSVGYGPTEPQGRTMSMNFGPLNRQGGERRLNVAITRATTEVHVFASFDASMIDLTRTSAQAVEDLKHYIDYAARGPIALGKAIRSFGGVTGYDSDFEQAVAEELRQRGWNVRTQIGVSRFRIDLGIVHPDASGGFLAGVECDGASYHASPSARDRDRVRQIILENLGWRLFRIWSTDFYLDPQASIEGLHERLNGLLDEDRRVAAESAATVVDSDEDAWPSAEEPEGKAEADGSRENVGTVQAPELIFAPQSLETEWPERVARGAEGVGPDIATPADTNTIPDPSRFYDPQYRRTLQGMAMSIIDDEGPVTFKRLSTRLARAHGFQRTGKEIKRTIWDACRHLRERTREPDGNEIFWPGDKDPEKVMDFRGMRVGSAARDWSEVPYPEKLGLVASVLSQNPVDPARSVADAIGYSRLTSGFRTEIEALTGVLREE